jgi:metal-sulfur cluster biosynthetic enzyme
MTTRTVETVAEDAAATATADTATASHDAPESAADMSWRARMAAEEAAKPGTGDDAQAAVPDPVSETPVAETPATTGAKASVDDVEEAMKDVVDPELGINVVDLGLVYGVHVDDENVVTLDMTLTSAACPLTDVIEDQTRSALTTGPGGGLCSDFRINWVWLPPWGPDKITDEGRDQLRALGFNL